MHSQQPIFLFLFFAPTHTLRRKHGSALETASACRPYPPSVLDHHDLSHDQPRRTQWRQKTPRANARAKTAKTTPARCNVQTARNWERRATFAHRNASSATGYIARRLADCRPSHLTAAQGEHKKVHKSQSSILSNIFTPKVVSHPDPATGHYNPFPTYPYTGALRPVYPLSPRREVPKHIRLPDYAKDGIPRSEQVFVNRNKITILNKEEQDAMRKVCRYGREILDIAGRAAKPGVTTDYIDEIVHKATVERDVRIAGGYGRRNQLTGAVVPIAPQLLPFSQVCMHVSQRGHLPRHPRPKSTQGWRYSQHRHLRLPRRFPRGSERDLLHWRQGAREPRRSAGD